jgi:transposase
MAVMIGVDPHKGSHTAVAIGVAEEPLGRLRVRACTGQAEKLVAWAQAWPERTWAVEGAGGLGHLLAQQLVAARERVLDVPPKLAARVRLLQAGDTNKNDPNDALPVAIAALRSRAQRPVMAEDYSAVLKVRAKRHRDLARARNQVACRLHAVLCELVPGGFGKEISASQAARVLEPAQPRGVIAQARHELASQFLHDLRNLDSQLRDTKKKLAAAVRASRTTTLTGIFGAGPVQSSPAPSSATPATPRVSPAGIASPPATALPRSRSPPGTGRPAGCRCAATDASTTPSTWPRSPRSATGTATAAPTTTARSPRERPARKLCAASSGGSATRSTPASEPTPARPHEPTPRAREGNRGTTLTPARPAHTPQRRLFGQATPEPATTLRPAPRTGDPLRRRRSEEDLRTR